MYGNSRTTFAAQAASGRWSIGRIRKTTFGSRNGSTIFGRPTRWAGPSMCLLSHPLHGEQTACAIQADTRDRDGCCHVEPFALRRTVKYVPCRGKYRLDHFPSTCSLVSGVPPQKTHDEGRRGSAGAGYAPFAQRALAAFLAISLLRRALSDSARAFPPLRPPMRPSATAAGFLSPFVAARTMAAARTLGSVLLERLGIHSVCHARAWRVSAEPTVRHGAPRSVKCPCAATETSSSNWPTTQKWGVGQQELRPFGLLPPDTSC